MRRFFPLFLLLTSVLAGCGGGSANYPVYNPGGTVTVIPAAASLMVGNALQLQAEVVTTDLNQVTTVTTPKGSWSSADAQIVKVNSNGLLLGISPGNTVVTFTCSSSCQSVDVGVTVTPRATSLTIRPPTATINAGDSLQFAAIAVIGGSEQDVTGEANWSLNNYLGGGAIIYSGLLDPGLLETLPGSVMTPTVIQVTVSFGGLNAAAPVLVNP